MRLTARGLAVTAAVMVLSLFTALRLLGSGHFNLAAVPALLALLALTVLARHGEPLPQRTRR